MSRDTVTELFELLGGTYDQKEWVAFLVIRTVTASLNIFAIGCFHGCQKGPLRDLSIIRPPDEVCAWNPGSHRDLCILENSHVPAVFEDLDANKAGCYVSHIDAIVKKAQQHLFFLKWFRNSGMSVRILNNYYRRTTESILSRCIMAWYSNRS
eukprot:g35843.t1